MATRSGAQKSAKSKTAVAAKGKTKPRVSAKAPVKAPAKAAAKATAKAPARAPVKATAKAPVRAAAKAPVRALAKSPARASAPVPARSASKAVPARAPSAVVEKPRTRTAVAERPRAADVVDAELVEIAQPETAGQPGLELPTEEFTEGFTSDGRYIPYGGGLMGWFENAGVLKVEKGNRYQYFTVVETDSVRGLQFRRWGQGFNRRGDRARIRKEAHVTMNWGQGKKKESCKGKTKDISMQGMRLQFFEEINLSKGSEVEVALTESSGAEVLTVTARVVWFESVGRIRPVINVGIGFPDLEGEHGKKLKEFLGED